MQERGHVVVISSQVALSVLEKPWKEEEGDTRPFIFSFECLILVKFTC